MNAGLGLALLAAAGGGIYLATRKANASPSEGAATTHRVTASDGHAYDVTMVSVKPTAEGDVLTFEVADTNGIVLLHYAQYRDDNDSRIWDNTLPSVQVEDPRFTEAAKDFGIFLATA